VSLRGGGTASLKNGQLMTHERRTVQSTHGLMRDGSWSYRRSFVMLSFMGIAGWAIVGMILWYSLLR
jgi:hypothetical protein